MGLFSKLFAFIFLPLLTLSVTSASAQVAGGFGQIVTGPIVLGQSFCPGSPASCVGNFGSPSITNGVEADQYLLNGPQSRKSLPSTPSYVNSTSSPAQVFLTTAPIQLIRFFCRDQHRRKFCRRIKRGARSDCAADKGSVGAAHFADDAANRASAGGKLSPCRDGGADPQCTASSNPNRRLGPRRRITGVHNRQKREPRMRAWRSTLVSSVGAASSTRSPSSVTPWPMRRALAAATPGRSQTLSITPFRRRCSATWTPCTTRWIF